MMREIAGFDPRGMSPRPLAGWMVAREQRRERWWWCWLLLLILAGAIALIDDRWLWAPVAVAGARGAVMVVLWTRVLWARWRSVRTGVVRVFAAVPSSHVPSRSSSLAPGSDDLVGGVLRALDDRWVWRPHESGGGGGQLVVPGAQTVAVLNVSAHDPGMPAAYYVRIVRRHGDEIELLVWDYGRVPPLSTAVHD